MDSSTSALVEIHPLSPPDVDEIRELWSQYMQNAGLAISQLASAWKDSEHIGRFVDNHAAAGTGVVARQNGSLVAFMAYDRFTFHGEDTAFVPPMGHARKPGETARVYQRMYRAVADALVAQGCLNHILLYAAEDDELKRVAFDLGFGLYAVDAFGSSAGTHVPAGNGFSISEAAPADVSAIHRLVVQFDRHYRGSPLFLCRTPECEEDVQRLVASDTGAVFTAETDERTVGFLNVQIAAESDPISLVRSGMGIIEPLGAYIQPEFRGCGVGAALVGEARRWCRERNVAQIHVDFESANIEANAFWPKHFKPTLYSAKRTVNKDILDPPTASGRRTR
jgi:GNAT superfamily N-acetyltransferase